MGKKKAISLGYPTNLQLIYRDRAGDAITKKQWDSLVRDRDYCIIKQHSELGWEAEVAWLGVGSTRERTPKYYVIQGWNKEAKERSLAFMEWCECESKALECYESCLQAMRRAEEIRVSVARPLATKKKRS